MLYFLKVKMQNYLTNFNMQYLPSRWLGFLYFWFLLPRSNFLLVYWKKSLSKPGFTCHVTYKARDLN